MSESRSTKKDDKSNVRRSSLKIIASFQLGNMIWFMINQGFRMRIYEYNVNVLGLNNILFLLAFGIFTIYNMINDPLIGHFCDRSTRLVERWGKRFPFILMGAFPFSFMLMLVFFNPFLGDQLGMFFWFVGVIILFDTFFSLMDVNRWGLFPQKFPSDKERKLAGFVEAILDTLGIALGFIIPAIILDPGVIGETVLGYFVQAAFLSGLSFILVILMIPGVRETKEVRERQMKLDQFEYTSMMEDLKLATRNKDFLGYLILFVSYSITMGAIMAVMSTFTTEILKMPGLIGELSFLGYLIFVPLSAPLWYRYSDKVGIRKVLLLGAICMPIAGIPLFFAPGNILGFILTFVVASVAGIADGAIESMNSPVFSSIVDKTAVDNKRREEGLYRGVVVFFQRTSYFIWLFFLIIAQAIAGTNLGLRIYISLFPVMVMGIGVISFLKLYTITQEDLEKNILELEKLNV